MSGRGLHLMAFNLAKAAEAVAAELRTAADALTLTSTRLVATLTLCVIVFGAITKLAIAVSRLARLEEGIAMQPQQPELMVGPMKNERHEVFAYLVANGVSAPQSYARAYACGVDPGTRVSAHRLLKKANVRRRIRRASSRNVTEGHRHPWLHRRAIEECGIGADQSRPATRGVQDRRPSGPSGRQVGTRADLRSCFGSWRRQRASSDGLRF